MTFRELTSEEYNQFAKSYKYISLYQSVEYKEFSDKEGYNTIYLGLQNNTNIVAACLMVYKGTTFKYGYIPKGILIDYSDYELLDYFTKELKKYASKLDIVAFKMNPVIVKNIFDSNYNLKETNQDYKLLLTNLDKCGYTHLGYNKYFESLMPRYEAVIDLTKDKYELFSNMSKQYRTKTRSSELKGVRIYKGTIDDLEEVFDKIELKRHPLTWYKNILESFKDNADFFYAKLDMSIYLKLSQNNYINHEKYNSILNQYILDKQGIKSAKILDKKMQSDLQLNEYHKKLDEAIKLSSSKKEGLILCLAIVVKDKNGASLLDLSYDKTNTKFNASHLLIWKLMEYYQELGYTYLNLGGVAANEYDSKYKGLNNFKLGFGSNVYEFTGDLEYIVNYPKFVIYKKSGLFFK